MQPKQIINYPNTKNFANFLNNLGSMTKELKNLNSALKIELLRSDSDLFFFIREVFIKLDQTSVIASSSITTLNNKYFVDMLRELGEQPLGERLFENYSRIKRVVMNNKLLNLESCSKLVKELKSIKYNEQQHFWCRTSIFLYQNERLYVREIILPELAIFIPT